MPAEILKRPQALRDIEECFVFIAEDNLEAGIGFLEAVEVSLRQISEFPFIGKQRDFADQKFTGVRMWHVKDFEKYLIFYLVTREAVEIIRVLQGSRDIEQLFQ